MMIHKYSEKYHDLLFTVFRVIVGALFFTHGGIKLFGWYGGLGGAGSPVALASLTGVAGIIELTVGAALVLGIFVRLGALIAAVELIIGFFKVHLPNGFSPFVNGSEILVLFVVAFLVLLVHGAGKWSLEHQIWKKEFF